MHWLTRSVGRKGAGKFKHAGIFLHDPVIAGSYLSVERGLLVVLDQLDEALELRRADDEETSLLLYQAVFDL